MAAGIIFAVAEDNQRLAGVLGSRQPLLNGMPDE